MSYRIDEVISMIEQSGLKWLVRSDKQGYLANVHADVALSSLDKSVINDYRAFAIENEPAQALYYAYLDMKIKKDKLNA